MKVPEADICQGKTIRIVEILDQSNALVPECQSLFELSAFGQAARQPAQVDGQETGTRSGVRPAEAASRTALTGTHHPAHELRGPDEIAGGIAREPEILCRCELERGVLLCAGELPCSLDERTRLSNPTHLPETIAELERHPTLTSLVAQCLGDALGLREVSHDYRESPERIKRSAHVEAQVHGLLHRLARLGEMRQRRERLLEPRHRFLVCPAAVGPDPGLPEIHDRLVPDLALQRMVCQPFDLLGQAAGILPLDRLDDPRVQHTPAILKQAPIRHIAGQDVAERVLDVGKQA